MSNFCFAQACSSSNSSFTTVALRSCGQVSRISLPPPPPPSCTEFNNFKYRVRRRFQSPSYLRRSSLHSACSYSLPFPLASSVSASRGSFSGYRRRKLEVRASASELFQQEHGEGKPTESAETPDIAPQSLRTDPASELKVSFSSTFALNCCEQHSPRYALLYIFRGRQTTCLHLKPSMSTKSLIAPCTCLLFVAESWIKSIDSAAEVLESGSSLLEFRR